MSEQVQNPYQAPACEGEATSLLAFVWWCIGLAFDAGFAAFMVVIPSVLLVYSVQPPNRVVFAGVYLALVCLWVWVCIQARRTRKGK